MEKKITATIIYLPKTLKDQTKMFALLTNVSMSSFIRHAIRDKIEKLKNDPVSHC